MSGPSLVWFRADLRLLDNPALAAAATGPAIPVFIWSPEDEGPWAPGAASRWWLHRSLASLDAGLRERGSRLILRRGPTVAALRSLIRDTGATSVTWNRRYEPAADAVGAAVKSALAELGVEARSFNGSLLREPMDVLTGAGKPYQVFTPFSNAHLALPPGATPRPAPKSIPAPKSWPASEPLDSLGLTPTIAWDAGLAKEWTPGEDGAARRLARFVRSAMPRYDTGRDVPGEEGTSRLSPHLHFGEISPRQIFQALDRAAPRHPDDVRSLKRYRMEILWRDFAHHLLHHFPQTPEHPLRPAFEKFPWKAPGEGFDRWKKGRTGYPFVDAGMRELWTTGWMHNRVRMIVASFLVKDLGIDWRAGAAWFWDTLVDADLANNTLGWQWSAGCGADAAPFFRIFNPILQGERFDPAGVYVRRWVPELARLPDKWIHKPWQTPPEVLRSAGVAVGTTYPAPFVDHAAARDEALRAFRKISEKR